MIGVQDHGDAVQCGHLVNVVCAGDAPGDRRPLVVIPQPFPGKKDPSPIRELDDNWRINRPCGFQNSVNGVCAGDVGPGNGKFFCLGNHKKRLKLISGQDTGGNALLDVEHNYPPFFVKDLDMILRVI